MTPTSSSSQKSQLVAPCPSRDSEFVQTKLVKNTFCKPIIRADLDKKTLTRKSVTTYEVELPHLYCDYHGVDYYDRIEETRCISVAPSEGKGFATHIHQDIVSKVSNWRSEADIEDDTQYDPEVFKQLMELPFSIKLDTLRDSPNVKLFSGFNRTTYLLENGTGYKVPKIDRGVIGSYLRTERDAELIASLYSSPNYYGGQFKEYIPELIRVEVDSNTSLFGLKFRQFKEATLLSREDTLPPSALEELEKSGFTTIDRHPANFVKVTLNNDQECYVLIDAK